MVTDSRPGPRERLLRAARELTYRDGIGVGVDAILREADAARRSLYEHFGGKDGLIAAVLHQVSLEDEAKYAAVFDRGGADPAARILAVFDWLDEATARPGYRGCRFTAADLTVADPDHPAHAEARAHKLRIHAMLRREAEALGHPDPEDLADQLQLLIEGVLIRAAMAPQTHPARPAKRLAQKALAP